MKGLRLTRRGEIVKSILEVAGVALFIVALPVMLAMSAVTP